MRLREISDTKHALAGEVGINFVTDLPEAEVNILLASMWRQVFLFEKSFSRFVPMSELSVFNRQAGLKLPISTEFKKLLLAAKHLGEQTNGLYNPFILPALQRAGYIQSAAEGYEQDTQEDYSNKRVVAVERLEIGDAWALIPHGTAIDLGGCGKGYLADLLASLLKNQGVMGYWLSLSGDIAAGGTDENDYPIYLNIQNAIDPLKNSDWLIKCPVTPAGIATSGTFRRKSQAGNKKWHHLIDPATGRPASTDVRLATIVADTAITADVLASCAVILGSQKAPEFLKKHGVNAALLQCTDIDGNYFEIKFGDCIQKEAAFNQKKELLHA